METNTTDISGEVTAPVYNERFEYKLEIIPPYSVIQCRKATIIERDGVEVGRTYHRHTRAPGEDVSNDCTEVKRCAAVLWTPDLVAAYKATLPEEALAVEEGTSTMPTEELEYKPISELL